MLRSVYPSELPDVWETVEPWLKEIVDKSQGRMTMRVVAEQLVKAFYQLWIAEEEEPIAVALTQVMQFETGVREFEIIGVYGPEMKKFLPYMNDLIEATKDMNVARIRVPSLPAFERLLKPYGFEKSHVTMVLEL